jgi:cytochrome c oxidase accessory protein FixG
MATTPSVKSRPVGPVEQDQFTWHKARKIIHVICFSIFVLLPFFDIMRFDIPRQRFYFAGQELWINEFAIIFFALMFLMFVVAGASMLYGRIFCGYACPQMIFSEASISMQNRIRKYVNKKLRSSKKTKRLVSGAIFYSTGWVASTFLAFVFISYFVEPRDLLNRLMSFDIATAGGIAGASVTILTFFDFAFLRQRFCTTICPYGYMQGMLADKHTLLVEYRDGVEDNKVCIECKKCVRVCHMGIDIRDSPHQIECIHCGECIDACEDVLTKIGEKTLIHYTWGQEGEVLGEGAKPWYYKLGFRDAKRVAVLLVLMFFLSGLLVALSMRNPVLVRFAPLRTEGLYTVGANGEIHNRFRVSISNRSREDSSVRIAAEGLDGARIVLVGQPIAAPVGATVEREFEIVKPLEERPGGIIYFQLTAQTGDATTPEPTKMTFIMPTDSAKGSAP